MGIGKQSRLHAIAVTALSVLVLGACSNAPQKADEVTSPRQAVIEEKQKEAAELQAKIDGLTKEKQAELAKSNAGQKKLPYILAETDSALKLAEQYRKNASKQKDEARKSEQTERANKAQGIADQKGVDLIAVRKEVYASLGKVSALDKQIKALTTIKTRAEQVAKAEAAELAKLKQTSGSKVAGSPKKSM